jgi:hypothetical protein
MSTKGFTQKARTKIRRAVENSQSPYSVMVTLTFAPSSLPSWCFVDEVHPDFNGPLCPGVTSWLTVQDEKNKPHVVPAMRRVVRHDFAKYRVKLLRQALTMRVNRQIKCKLAELHADDHADYIEQKKFRYVWAAELQTNGNIHFHMLVNKYFPASYLRKLWSYGAVNVKHVRDANHAANYISKYISKSVDGDIINGRRYDISQNARKDAKPMTRNYKFDDEAIAARKAIMIISEAIQSNGGRVIGSGFGVSIPKPRRSTFYKDKTGRIKKTRGVSSTLHNAFMDSIFPVPF